MYILPSLSVDIFCYINSYSSSFNYKGIWDLKYFTMSLIFLCGGQILFLMP